VIDRLHPKRDEKICQEILHNKNPIGMDEWICPAKKKNKKSSNWDGQICHEIFHEKHPIRMETDMTRNIT
jgi:hypothetical protein